jgi:enoyl-CoA hydratase/carnithine racemase
MAELVTYESNESGYGVIRLQRPEKRNAISLEMGKAIKSKLAQAETDDLKFLILTSSEKSMFCAGGDLHDLHGDLTNEEAHARLYPMMELLHQLLRFPVPVIAILNGDALGGGCELATACDIRMAYKDTKFGFIQTNIGILPGWGGGSMLYQKVQPSFALDWITSGSILPASILQEKGWIHHLVEDETQEIEEILSPYLKKSREQMCLLKSQFIANLDTAGLLEQMKIEVKASASLWDSEAHKQALNEFSAKKK